MVAFITTNGHKYLQGNLMKCEQMGASFCGTDVKRMQAGASS